jgi:hypothetical protein
MKRKSLRSSTRRLIGQGSNKCCASDPTTPRAAHGKKSTEPFEAVKLRDRNLFQIRRRITVKSAERVISHSEGIYLCALCTRNTLIGRVTRKNGNKEKIQNYQQVAYF